MSHFSVLVRLPGWCVDLEGELAKILLPYKESGCGDEDPLELKQYLKFQDDEDEYLDKFKTDTCSRVRLPDGESVSAYDERFRNRNRDLLSNDEQYIFPKGSVKEEVPLNVAYTSFEEYMSDYCGYKQMDPKTNRYGRWSNPNQKWDYWRIGGRWRGKLPLKNDFAFGGYGPVSYEWNYEEGGAPSGEMNADFTPISNINFAEVERLTEEKLRKFWGEWQELLAGKKFDFGDGPRDRALSLGMLDCKSQSELTGTEFKVVQWENRDDLKEPRYDVFKNVTIEWLRERSGVFSPISTWARLDANGWQEKGEMGWFGCGSGTPESTAKFAQSHLEWIKSGDQGDVLVVVDCHI